MRSCLEGEARSPRPVYGSEERGFSSSPNPSRPDSFYLPLFASS
jgi:hypothetical protein